MFIFYLPKKSRCYCQVKDAFSNIVELLLLLYLPDLETKHLFLSAKKVHLEHYLSASLLPVMHLTVLVN